MKPLLLLALVVTALAAMAGSAAAATISISGGGNVLLQMATKQPQRITAMVLVSATPYFPAQARSIMAQYPDGLPEQQWEILRRRHPGGDTQIKAILASTKSFATSYDDLNFTPPLLSTIQARTFIIQGDRDPLYPVELSVEIAKSIPALHRFSLVVMADADVESESSVDLPVILDKTCGRETV